jgi:hypothetical protein
MKHAQNKCISSSSGSTDNNNNVQIWDCGSGAAFDFSMPAWGTGYIRMAKSPNKCISVSGGETWNGNTIQIWDCGSGPEVHDSPFSFIMPSSDTDVIRMAKDSTKCMSVSDGQTWNGNNVQIWDCGQGPAFDFEVTPL